MLSVGGAGGDLVFLTWIGSGGASRAAAEAEEAYAALGAAAAERGVVPIQERVFVDLWSAPAVAEARSRALASGAAEWAVPPTCIEGAPLGRDGLAGIHVLAARGATARLVQEGPHVYGRVVDGPAARLVCLADVGRRAGGRLAAGPAEEAGAAINAAVDLLGGEGFTFRDVARTWFYLRDILDWYGPFNAVRNEAFRRLGLLGHNGNGKIPASTGIAGRNSRGGFCTLDLIAVRAQQGAHFEMKRLHTRKQNEATDYGSAFARGVSLTLGDHRYVFVSGTASIDDHGLTVHVGDFDAQLRHTTDAVQAVLAEAGATLADVCQATSFLKRPSDAAAYTRFAERNGLCRIPPVETVADVCRDDLLYEIDATAVVPARRGSASR
jgi:enamine deaminase RidA (YjgF/YER057c/UK114 family)